MRLTEWRGEHAAIVNHHENYIDKLAAYEDTGYSPIEIKSLEGEWNAMRKVVDSYRKAEEQGLLVRLPCKVGDTLYALTRNFISEFRVSQFDYDGHEQFLWVEWYLKKGISGDCRLDGIGASEIGKTVFLTREEAEAALKGGQEDV